MRSLSPLLTVLMLTLAACGGSGDLLGDGGGSDSAPASAEGPAGAWLLEPSSLEGGVPAGARVTLDIDVEEGATSVGGRAACNQYFGDVTIDADGGWQGTGYGHTEMGCEPELMDVESAYLTALAGISGWERPDADTLVLTGAGVMLRFALVPEVAPATFSGTTWVVDGFVTGTGDSAGISSPRLGVGEATVRFEDDGTFSLYTGCRDFEGEWTPSGDTIDLPSWGQAVGSRGVGADGSTTCGEQEQAQEADVLAVLESGVQAVVDGARLTLTSGDRGLSLRAALPADEI